MVNGTPDVAYSLRAFVIPGKHLNPGALQAGDGKNITVAHARRVEQSTPQNGRQRLKSDVIYYVPRNPNDTATMAQQTGYELKPPPPRGSTVYVPATDREASTFAAKHHIPESPHADALVVKQEKAGIPGFTLHGFAIRGNYPNPEALQAVKSDDITLVHARRVEQSTAQNGRQKRKEDAIFHLPPETKDTATLAKQAGYELKPLPPPASTVWIPKHPATAVNFAKKHGILICLKLYGVRVSGKKPEAIVPVNTPDHRHMLVGGRAEHIAKQLGVPFGVTP